MHVRTNEDMNRAILAGLGRVPRDVDLVVGIPRSGLLAGLLFSLYLNRPITDLAGLGERRLVGTGKRYVPGLEGDVFDSARRILVVDDCVSEGTEMRKARSRVEQLGYADRATFLAVFAFPEHPRVADLVLETVPRPMCFEWSLMHSPNLANFCVDIDGILCLDPTPDQDDDGARYADFLQNAVPLFLPETEIGWLVTCRIEKYRAETEDWLARHGVRYRNLVMMDHPSHEARRQARGNAAYKAEVYAKTGAQLFIESSAGMAREIESLSGRPVLHFETGALSHTRPSQQLDVLWNRVQFWRQRLRRAPSKLATYLTRGGRPDGD